MGGLTSAVHWWEESQLRVLVLSSMAVQVLLFIFSWCRRYAVSEWVRSITWLAYLAGDAVAIYALATLFNRLRDQECGGGGRNISTLEVMWAPVLLLHLGGHDGITAYNIEDNELWSRHLVTVVSQVTVAIYVFCKSWPPDGDKRLLLAGILLFIPGVLKCFLKAWALKSASIYSLVSSSAAATARQNKDQDMYPLQEYVKRAKEFVDLQDQDHTLPTPRREEHGNNVVDDMATPAAAYVDGGGHSPSSQGKGAVDNEGTTWPPCGEEDKDHSSSIIADQGYLCAQLYQQTIQLRNEKREVWKLFQGFGEASYKLFVDLSSPYGHRLSMLNYFWGISEERAYRYVQRGLVAAFLLLYTKLKTAGFVTRNEVAAGLQCWDIVKIGCRVFVLYSRIWLPWAAIGLFHHRSTHSEEEAAARSDSMDDDIKITYAIFCCTAVLETCSALPIAIYDSVWRTSLEKAAMWPEKVAQYSLIGHFASSHRRRKPHNWCIIIARKFGYKCIEPCSSSAIISRLVLGYLKDGWKKQIHDAPSYRMFNDHRRRWPVLLGYMMVEGHHVGLSGSMAKRKRAFDESVLLWHIATDFCFFSGSFAEHTTTCSFARVPGFVDIFFPETAGFIKTVVRKCARGTNSPIENHQTTSASPCGEDSTACKAVLCTQMSNYMVYLLFLNPEMLLPGSRRNLFTTALEELEDIFKNNGEKPPLGLKKRELTPKIISKLESSQTGSGTPETFIHEAWMVAQALRRLGDQKMWEVIQGVWVEMLCYSASRCRGYLHAKALGEGGEFLSYVWLLLFYMGMETFTDKLKREEPPRQEFETGNDNTTAPPSTPNISTTGTTAPSTSEICIIDVFTTGAGAAPSTSEICMAEEDMVNVSTTGTTAPSTPEICIIDYVFTTDAGAAPSTS